MFHLILTVIWLWIIFAVIVNLVRIIKAPDVTSDIIGGFIGNHKKVPSSSPLRDLLK